MLVGGVHIGVSRKGAGDLRLGIAALPVDKIETKGYTAPERKNDDKKNTPARLPPTPAQAPKAPKGFMYFIYTLRIYLSSIYRDVIWPATIRAALPAKGKRRPLLLGRLGG